MKDFVCVRCEKEILRGYGRIQRYCYECRRDKDKIITANQRMVRAAVLRGEIPSARTLKCVDCGVQAQCYDHRHIDRPLDVDPVCNKCNFRRGPASWKAA